MTEATTGWVAVWWLDGYWKRLGDFESEAKARRFIDRHEAGGEFVILPSDLKRVPPDTRPTIRIQKMRAVERTNMTRTPGVYANTARTAPAERSPRGMPAVRVG